jgi:LPXTG-site transpeptidase (sortase) family protein
MRKPSMIGAFLLAIMALILVSVTGAAQGGATYFTDIAPGNLDVYFCYPEFIEFDIDVTGPLPTASAYLTINAYDVDEESGEVDHVWINGNFLGALNGNNDTWNTTIFNVPIGWVVSGLNTIRVQVTTEGWCVEIDWGQLLVDGGAAEAADITSLRIDSYTIVGGTVDVVVSATVEGFVGGTYRLEIALLDPSNNNIGTVFDTFTVSAGETVTRINTPSYPLSSGSGTYTIQAALFDDTTGIMQNIEIITFYHEEGVGPNSPPVIDLDADDSGPVSGTGYAATLQAPGQIRIVDTDLTVTDNDNTDLASATVTLVNNPDGANEGLTAATGGTSITATYDSGTGVLSLTGTDTVANYIQVLRSVYYFNNAADPDLTIRTVEFVVNDGTADSNTAISQVTIILSLPETGFAPGRHTDLPSRIASNKYLAVPGYWLEIPSQGEMNRIVYVPLSEQGWDLAWLGGDVGYLEGTAFPTWLGVTALTAHVYLADGTPGPFLNLRELMWGDSVVLHANGYRYEYSVRENLLVRDKDISTLRHEDYDWVVLITCEGYNEALDRYDWRRVVRAVLISVDVE